MKTYRIFAINPGSTSTKVALFENDRTVFSANVAHDAQELSRFREMSEQLPYRRETILRALADAGLSLEGTDAFSGRGGGLVSLEGGTYGVNELLLHHARICFTVRHPAVLGSQLAHEFASEWGGRAFVVNPPDVDEFDEAARLTGWRGVYRESRIHALNQKEIGIRHAATAGRKYEDMNFIIAHIGGGVSVTAHRKGRMIDSNDIVNGDGPMAPTRAGALPARDVIRACFSGRHTERELMDRLTKDGGFVDLLGTADVLEVKKRIADGDAKSKLAYDAMILQIAKQIGAMAAALEGEVDGILLTGGIAKDRELTARLERKVGFIAPVTVLAGEFEMEALAAGALRVLTGEEQEKTYTGVPVWKGEERG